MLFSCRTENSGRRAAVTRRISFRDTALAKPVEQALEFVQIICRVERFPLSMNRSAGSHVRADMAVRAPAVQCSWSQSTTSKSWGLSMNRPDPSQEASKAFVRALSVPLLEG